MARNRGPGRPIQKGQVLNPTGRPPIPEELKEMRKLTRASFQLYMNKYIHMSVDELEMLAADKKLPAIEKMVMAVVLRAIKDADTTRLNFLAENLLGKLKEPDQNHNFNFHMMPRAQVIEMGKEAIKYLQKADKESDDDI